MKQSTLSSCRARIHSLLPPNLPPSKRWRAGLPLLCTNGTSQENNTRIPAKRLTRLSFTTRRITTLGRDGSDRTVGSRHEPRMIIAIVLSVMMTWALRRGMPAEPREKVQPSGNERTYGRTVGAHAAPGSTTTLLSPHSADTGTHWFMLGSSDSAAIPASGSGSCCNCGIAKEPRWDITITMIAAWRQSCAIFR